MCHMSFVWKCALVLVADEQKEAFHNTISLNFCEGPVKVVHHYFMCEILPKCKDKFGVVTKCWLDIDLLFFVRKNSFKAIPLQKSFVIIICDIMIPFNVIVGVSWIFKRVNCYCVPGLSNLVSMHSFNSQELNWSLHNLIVSYKFIVVRHAWRSPVSYFLWSLELRVKCHNFVAWRLKINFVLVLLEI